MARKELDPPSSAQPTDAEAREGGRDAGEVCSKVRAGTRSAYHEDAVDWRPPTVAAFRISSEICALGADDRLMTNRMTWPGTTSHALAPVPR